MDGEAEWLVVIHLTHCFVKLTLDNLIILRSPKLVASVVLAIYCIQKRKRYIGNYAKVMTPGTEEIHQEETLTIVQEIA